MQMHMNEKRLGRAEPISSSKREFPYRCDDVSRSAGDHRSQDPSAGWQMPVPPDAKGPAAAAAAVHDGGLVIMSAAGGGGDGEGEGGGNTPLDLPDVPADESEGMDEGASFWYQSAGGGELFCEVSDFERGQLSFLPLIHESRLWPGPSWIVNRDRK
jgi:hypothetical protein